MWETVKQILLSQHPWSAIFYLFVGVVAGAFISIWYSLKAQRPRLVISGGGSGGNEHYQSWQITISNRPSFFGQNLDGESARDVHAQLQPKGQRQSYMLSWDDPREERTTIEPGQQKSLTLFHWNEGAGGYFIVDHGREPVARFQSRKLGFRLWFYDRLERRTDFSFTVEFDDTHLKNTPSLQIVHPLSLAVRLNRAKSGVQRFLSAFRAR